MSVVIGIVVFITGALAGFFVNRYLSASNQEQQKLADQHGKYVPMAVKIAPDLETSDIVDIAQILIKQEVDGVIATNTTISREGVEDHLYGGEMGGLSGAPLTERSTDVISKLSRELDGALPIIGVGGICTGEDAAEKMAAGASLVQIYSGFIYRGPKLIREAVDAIASTRTSN